MVHRIRFTVRSYDACSCWYVCMSVCYGDRITVERFSSKHGHGFVSFRWKAFDTQECILQRFRYDEMRWLCVLHLCFVHASVARCGIAWRPKHNMSKIRNARRSTYGWRSDVSSLSLNRSTRDRFPFKWFQFIFSSAHRLSAWELVFRIWEMAFSIRTVAVGFAFKNLSHVN